MFLKTKENKFFHLSFISNNYPQSTRLVHKEKGRVYFSRISRSDFVLGSGFSIDSQARRWHCWPYRFHDSGIECTISLPPDGRYYYLNVSLSLTVILQLEWLYHYNNKQYTNYEVIKEMAIVFNHLLHTIYKNSTKYFIHIPRTLGIFI